MDPLVNTSAIANFGYNDSFRYRQKRHETWFNADDREEITEK